MDVRLVPDYYDIVAHPMDLTQVQENIDSGHYECPQQFMQDMQLIVDNVVLYNPRHDPNRLVHRAHAMLDEAMSWVNDIDPELVAACDALAARRHGEHSRGPPAATAGSSDLDQRCASRTESALAACTGG